MTARVLVVACGVLVGVAGLGACGDEAAGAGPQVAAEDAFVTEGTTALAVYLSLSNPGGPDRIVDVELTGDDADLATDVTLHQTSERDGLSIMEPTDAIEVAGGTDQALGFAEAHVMLEGVTVQVASPGEVTLRLDLEEGADLDVTARVVGPDEAVALLTEAGR